MDGGRPGGTSVLYPARAFEAQIRGGLKHQRGSKILGRETGIEMPEHDLVDIAGGDPSIGERLGRDPHDQTLDRLSLEATKGGVSPANNASGHDGLLSISTYLSFLDIAANAQAVSVRSNLPNFGRFL